MNSPSQLEPLVILKPTGFSQRSRVRFFRKSRCDMSASPLLYGTVGYLHTKNTVTYAVTLHLLVVNAHLRRAFADLISPHLFFAEAERARRYGQFELFGECVLSGSVPTRHRRSDDRRYSGHAKVPNDQDLWSGSSFRNTSGAFGVRFTKLAFCWTPANT